MKGHCYLNLPKATVKFISLSPEVDSEDFSCFNSQPFIREDMPLIKCKDCSCFHEIKP